MGALKSHWLPCVVCHHDRAAHAYGHGCNGCWPATRCAAYRAPYAADGRIEGPWMKPAEARKAA